MDYIHVLSKKQPCISISGCQDKLMRTIFNQNASVYCIQQDDQLYKGLD